MKELNTEQTIAIRKQILKEFHKMCEQNNIKYSIGYGTLLGAVRHNGMIPWDDDIDVIVTRDDFEKLCSLYKSKNCKDKYQFVSHRNHPEIKTKIGYYIDFDTITETAYKKSSYHGVHIDVYPIDVVPNGWLQRKLLFIHRRFLHILIRAKDVHPEVVKGKQKLIRQLILLACSPFNYDKAIDKLHTISKKYSGMPEKDRKTVCILVEAGSPVCFPYKVIKEYKQYNYEDNQYWGFKDYDCLLKSWYGDYMTPPPEKDRSVPEKKFVHYYFKDEA